MKHRRQNNALESHRAIILIVVMIMFVLLSCNFVSATAKTYDEATRTVTIKNTFLGIPTTTKAEIKLITPTLFKVPVGYNKVAEMEFLSYDDFKGYMSNSNFELYDIHTGKIITRELDFKFLTIEDVTIVDYETQCSEETLGNGTAIQNCKRIKTGSHLSPQEIWNDLSEYNFESGKPIKVGIFTNVEVNDNVEWIPTIYNVRITEWASWTADLNAGLLYYYKFDETTGTNGLESVDKILNLTTNNMENGDWVAGKIGNALRFGGTDEYAETTDNLSMSGNFNRTVAFWVNNSLATGSNYWGFVGLGIYAPLEYMGIAQQYKKVIVSFQGGDCFYDTASTLPLDYVHIVVMYDSVATNMSLWINGTYKSNCTKTSNLGLAPLRIGQTTSHTEYSQADIDELGIWNRTLTPAEITQLYNEGNGITYGGGSGFQINLTSPADDATLLDTEVDFGCYVTSTNPLINVSLYINGIINETNTSGINNTYYNFTKTMSLGSYNWSCGAFDNLNTSSVANAFNFEIKSFVTNSETYSNSTTEGNYETFIINITAVAGYQISSGNLIYNGVGYTGIVDTSNAPTYVITRSFVIPDVAADSNLTFYWNVTLSDVGNDVSTSHNQTVYSLSIDNCGANTNIIFNFTLKDEDNQFVINASNKSSIIEVDLNLYSSDRSALILNYSTNYSNLSYGAMCFSVNLSLGEEYSLDGEIKYSGTDYATEYYNLQNYNLTNSTINQNVTLYDLLSSNNQPFKITYKDSSFIPVSDALIQIQRKYISEGAFKIVEIPKTNFYGQTIANLVLNNIVYTFVVIKNGQTLATFTNQRVVCQNPTIYECAIELNSFSSGITVTNFSSASDFFYNLAFNKTTRVASADFVIPSGTILPVSLNVTEENAIGTYACSDILISSAGTLSCTIPSSMGNITLIMKLYKNDYLVGYGSANIGYLPSELYSGFAVLLAIFAMLTLIGAGISDNPVYTVIFFMFGFVLLGFLNIIVSTGFLGQGALILYLALAILLLVIKGSRRI